MTLNIRDYLKIVNMNELRQVYKSQYGPCGEELHKENFEDYNLSNEKCNYLYIKES